MTKNKLNRSIWPPVEGSVTWWEVA